MRVKTLNWYRTETRFGVSTEISSSHSDQRTLIGYANTP